MQTYRFACVKCGQHLACETPLLGKQITCPACNKRVWVLTEKLLECYRVLEVDSVASLDEVKAAHRERTQSWNKDRYPNDPRYLETATAKTKELNAAFETITAYFTGKSSEPPPSARAIQEEKRLEKETLPQRPSPEPRDQAKPTRPAAAGSAPGARNVGTRFWFLWVGLGVGATVIIALLAFLGIGLLERRGPALTKRKHVCAVG